MRATDFEFRYRFFIIVGVFVLGFFAYRVDPINVAIWLGHIASGDPLSGVVSPWAVRAFLILGTGLVFAAAALRTWASACLGADVVGDSVVRSEALVANGPFRYVRNPLYLGLILLAAGIGFAASRLGWLVLVAGTTLFLMRLTFREEAALQEKQGNAYAQFVTQVPRLFPSFTPRLPAGTTEPRWGQAFTGEMMMWGLVISMGLLAATQSAKLFQQTVALCFVAYAVVRVPGMFKK